MAIPGVVCNETWVNASGNENNVLTIYLHEIIHNCPEGQGLLLLFNTEGPYGEHTA